MFNFLTNVRHYLHLVVTLQSIWRELKRIADLMEARLALEHPEWYKSGGLNKKPRKVKLDNISVADVGKWNEAYGVRRSHQEDDNE